MKRILTARNGDLVAGDYQQALALAGARRLSLGICERRCSPMKNRKPLAFGWRGTDPASTHCCTVCGKPLRRMTHYRWAGSVQLIGVRREREQLLGQQAQAQLAS